MNFLVGSKLKNLFLILAVLVACSPNNEGSKNSDKSHPPQITGTANNGPPPEIKRGDLIRAAREGKIKKIEELLRAGVSINESIDTDNGRVTPLLAAIAMGHTMIVQYLLVRGADRKATFQGYSPEEFYTHRQMHKSDVYSLPWVDEKGKN